MKVTSALLDVYLTNVFILSDLGGQLRKYKVKYVPAQYKHRYTDDWLCLLITAEQDFLKFKYP